MRWICMEILSKMRLTDPLKWQDSWFLSRTPLQKLVFIYLYENCDEAGFIEVNYSLWAGQLSMTKEQILECLVGLKKALLSDQKKKIWIKKFLFYQKQLPLNATNPDHKNIILKLQDNQEKFKMAHEIHDILRATETKKKVRKKDASNFVAPTLEEWTAEYKKQYPPATQFEIEQHYNNMTGKGWKIGKNQTPAKDWVAIIRTGVNNLKQALETKQTGKDSGKKSRAETAFSLMKETTKS